MYQCQTDGYHHTISSGNPDDHRSNPGVLIALPKGWVCPSPGCEYTQYWAHSFMADEEFLATTRKYHEDLFALAESDPNGVDDEVETRDGDAVAHEDSQ